MDSHEVYTMNHVAKQVPYAAKLQVCSIWPGRMNIALSCRVPQPTDNNDQLREACKLKQVQQSIRMPVRATCIPMPNSRRALLYIASYCNELE